MKKYSTPAYVDNESGVTEFGSVDVYLASEVDARIAELEKYKHAVERHNRECDDLCNNAATCGYKSYFEANGRRCTTCPVYMKIVL